MKATQHEINQSKLFAAIGIGAMALSFFLCGCAMKTTISQDASGAIQISSSKDVSLKGLKATLPNGTSVSVESYDSKTNPDVVKAQAGREKGNITAGGVAAGQIIGQAINAAAKGGL